MLIGSPACKACSTWQILNRARTRDAAAMDRALAAAARHLDFVVSMYHKQIDGGRDFQQEHPIHARVLSVAATDHA